MNVSSKEFLTLSKDNCIVSLDADIQSYKNILFFYFNEKSIKIDLLAISYLNMGLSIPALLIEKNELVKLKEFLNDIL